MAKQKVKSTERVTKAASIVDPVYKALTSIKFPGALAGSVNRAKAAIVKLAKAVILYEGRQAKQAENLTRKSARDAAKQQKAAARVKSAAVKTARIQARIAKLQEQLKRS